MNQTPKDEFLYVQRRRVDVVSVPRAVARDGSISNQARGMLVQLLSFDTDERISLNRMVEVGQDGHHALRSALRELSVAGYVHSRRTHNALGHPTGNAWLIFDMPTPREIAFPDEEPVQNPVAQNGKPKKGKPYLGKPYLGKPDLGTSEIPQSAQSLVGVIHLKESNPAESATSPSPAFSTRKSDTVLSLSLLDNNKEVLVGGKGGLGETPKRTRHTASLKPEEQELADIWLGWLRTTRQVVFTMSTSHIEVFKSICRMAEDNAKEKGVGATRYLAAMLEKSDRLEAYYQKKLYAPATFKANFITIAGILSDLKKQDDLKAGKTQANGEPVLTEEQNIRRAVSANYHKWRGQNGFVALPHDRALAVEDYKRALKLFASKNTLTAEQLDIKY